MDSVVPQEIAKEYAVVTSLETSLVTSLETMGHLVCEDSISSKKEQSAEMTKYTLTENIQNQLLNTWNEYNIEIKVSGEIKTLEQVNIQEGLDKVEQDKVELNKVELDKVEQDKVEQDKVEQDEIEQDEVEQDKVEQDKVEQDKVELDKVELDKVEQDEIEQDEIEQDEVELDKVEQEEVEQEEVENYWKSKLRFFKLFHNGEWRGRFSGNKPKQAANKAFSSIMKGLNGDAELNISFTIKECTKNSQHKKYKYVGERKTLENPIDVYILQWKNLTLEELKNKIDIREEKQVSNVAIEHRRVITLFSGKEVTTGNKSVYFLTDCGDVFRKITYLFMNCIKKQQNNNV